MWTNFQHNNLRAGDEALAIWYYPREKNEGRVKIREKNRTMM
jgi:hypothetical protein